MSKTTPPQTDTARPSKGDAGRTDPAPSNPDDKLAPDAPKTDAEGGRISSADGRFVADHRPSR